ncbi:MraY family glycosyltransferase [Streptococcus hyovaginalis]|uniref:glycosyltransferase family 4 protein n=1 Tax=Streptococcus hyovaginalis TaxID=149015 RepID=UPI002A91FB24|nr:MraY family glycosyltransferase [Streptococcus hyovaginalis]MDY5973400.1 MraY family glycosyltransferase [Streptococcus hyovaginalis]
MLPFTLEFVLALIGAFLLSLILTPLVRFISFRVGAVDEPNARRINKVTMPSAGGLAIFLAFLIIALFVLPRLTVSVKSEIPYFDYIFPVLAGATVVTLTGYFDDIFEIAPKTKMLGIVVGALIIWAFTDFRFDSFKIPFGGPMLSFGPIVTFILTLLWIISITNAINLIDGLDGLVTGVSMISLGTMGLVSYFFLPQVDLFLTMTIFLLIAAILGFFPYNYHPAIIYGGDTGALFLGFMIGVLSLQGLKNATAVAVVTPVIILGVPIVDTAVAIVRRKLSGRKITDADKMHLHHRLLAMGFTHRGAVLVVYGIAIIFSLIALLLNISSRLGGILLITGLLFALEVLIESLEIWGEHRTPLFNTLKFIGNSDYRQQTITAYQTRKKKRK